MASHVFLTWFALALSLVEITAAGTEQDGLNNPAIPPANIQTAIREDYQACYNY
jgi:hypothetical protein